MPGVVDFDKVVPATLAQPAVGEPDIVQCTASAHCCRLNPGQRWICEVRENVNNDLWLRAYDRVYTAPIGPPGKPYLVEKKQLFHSKALTDPSVRPPREPSTSSGRCSPRGDPLGAVDVMIAGIALARDEPVVTRNAGEFERTPVRVSPY